jgi:hypothetical protein
MSTQDDELRELEKAATPGPWHASRPTAATVDVFYQDGTGEVIAHIGYSAGKLRANAAFIAAARAAIPRLLDENEGLAHARDVLLRERAALLERIAEWEKVACPVGKHCAHRERAMARATFAADAQKEKV